MPIAGEVVLIQGEQVPLSTPRGSPVADSEAQKKSHSWNGQKSVRSSR